jgi:hypothetical protein
MKIYIFNCPAMAFGYHQSVDHFLFCPFIPLVLAGLSRKENKFFLCELCVSSEAGGEKPALTYPHSKAGTISIAEGLRA